MAEDRYKEGFLVPVLGRVADWLKRNWLMRWLSWVCPRLKDPNPVATELYVICWFAAELAISAALCLFYDYVAVVGWLVYLLAALRGLEIIVRAQVDLANVISTRRTLVLAVINYFELMLWFGLIYALNYKSLYPPGTQPVTAFYFSIITQLTIGYGDVYAMGWLRIVAAAQGLIGALFVIVVLGQAVSAPAASNPGPK